MHLCAKTCIYVYYANLHTQHTHTHTHTHTYTVKLVYNDTLGATKMCCYNQVVVVTKTFSTETIDTVPNMCVVVKRLML